MPQKIARNSRRVSAERLAGRAAARAANAVWPLVEQYSARFPGGPIQPKWAPAPLVRGKERTFPTLGWPRRTDSLCPECVKEVRAEVLSGKRNLEEFIRSHPGEIKADIVEQGGKIQMVKECAKHGRFEDVMSIDPAFLARIERLFPGRDYL